MTIIFEKEESLDPETGKTKHVVKVNGLTCDTFQLKGKIAVRYVGLRLIAQDLDDALFWLRKAHSYLPEKSKSDDQSTTNIIYYDSKNSLDEDTYMSLKAFWYASIIIYGKCFVEAEGRGTRLNPRGHADKEYLDRHKKIMEYRNNLVAHDGGAFDSGEVIVAPNPNGPEFNVTAHLAQLDFEDDREFTIGFDELITHVRGKVKKIENKTLERILENEAKKEVSIWRKAKRSFRQRWS